MPELIPAEPGTPEWLAARRAGVTATDIVTILGLSRWDSVYSLFWRKMQQAPEVEDNDRFRLGRELEGYVAGRWMEENDQPVIKGALFRHDERAWQMATLDRIVTGRALVDPLSPYGVLELKTWADADKSSWQDGPPAQVRAQVLWQMDVMDVATGHVGVVFLPSGEFRSYTIEHYASEHFGADAQTCEYNYMPDAPDNCSVCTDLKLMRAAGEEFMARLRLELPPPDPDASMATLAAVRARFTRQPDKQAEIDHDVWRAWLEARNERDYHDLEARTYEILLREQAGEASVLTVDGQPVARRVISDAHVKAFDRHQDYLKRIEPKGDDSENVE
jgi:putative phage-type endonuclease